MRSAKEPLCSTGGFSSSRTTESVSSIGDNDDSEAELSLRGRKENSSSSFSSMSSSLASSSLASSFASWIWLDRRWLARTAMLLPRFGSSFFGSSFFGAGFASAGFITSAFSLRFSVSRWISVSTCPSDSASTMRLR